MDIKTRRVSLRKYCTPRVRYDTRDIVIQIQTDNIHFMNLVTHENRLDETLIIYLKFGNNITYYKPAFTLLER